MERIQDYSQIANIKQLREERAKLQQRIAIKEIEIQKEYQNLKESLSIVKIITLLINRITLAIPLLKAIQELWRYIKGWFKRDDKGERIEDITDNEIGVTEIETKQE